MRPFHHPGLILAVALLGGLSLRADIEFAGVLTTAGNSTFALADTATTATRWLTIGNSFSGWKITAYNPAAETLTLVKDTATRTLKLKTAVLQEAEAAGPVSFSGDLKIQVGNSTMSGLTTLTDGVTNAITLANGVVVQITPRVQSDGSILYKGSFTTAPGPDGKPGEVLSSPSVLSRPGQSFSMQVGDISFGFAPSPAPAKP